jgi:hypothetical protein
MKKVTRNSNAALFELRFINNHMPPTNHTTMDEKMMRIRRVCMRILDPNRLVCDWAS